MTDIDQLDPSQSYDEPSTIDLIQIPLPPLRQLAGIPLALLPIQGIARLHGTELIKKHDVSHYCH